MNLNESIVKIRVDLQKKSLKQSGKNKFAGFTYFELSDFLPTLNELMLANKVNDCFSIEGDDATLTLLKGEESQVYKIPFEMFETPLSNNGKQSMQPIQYLGALNTYYKRYLYLNAFGITDGEIVDAMNNNEGNKAEKPQPQPNTPNHLVSASQVKLIQTRLSKLADRESNEQALKKHYKIESWNDLPAVAIEGLIGWFEKNGV